MEQNTSLQIIKEQIDLITNKILKPNSEDKENLEDLYFRILFIIKTAIKYEYFDEIKLDIYKSIELILDNAKKDKINNERFLSKVLFTSIKKREYNNKN